MSWTKSSQFTSALFAKHCGTYADKLSPSSSYVVGEQLKGPFSKTVIHLIQGTFEV